MEARIPKPDACGWKGKPASVGELLVVHAARGVWTQVNHLLPTAAAKLLFILFYFKCHPLQEVLAFFFGMSQTQACEWIKKLAPQINAVLGRELLLPARRPADLDTLLAQVPALRLLVIDGTERPTRRPKDKDEQKKNYRGKKKAHRKKNLLISSAKRVVYLGPTSPGSAHDKKLADQSGLGFPANALVLKDRSIRLGL